MNLNERRRLVFVVAMLATLFAVCRWLLLPRPVGNIHLHLGEDADLSGFIYEDKFFGAPNYGESPKTDKIETATIMRLVVPVYLDEPSGGRVEIKEVQLIGAATSGIGSQVRLNGTFDEATSGHDHRDYVFFVKPTIIDRVENVIWTKK